MSYIYIVPYFLLVIAVLTASGCSSTSPNSEAKFKENSQPHLVNNVLITEPLFVDYKSELAIAKLTQLVNHAKLDKDKLVVIKSLFFSFNVETENIFFQLSKICDPVQKNFSSFFG